MSPSTIYVLYPFTDLARAWIRENLEVEPWQRIGEGVAIEWRYVDAILKGIDDAGLFGQFEVRR